MKIKLDDTVEILTGNDKGMRGRVLKVDHEKRKLIVEGVNQVFKHVRRSQKNPQGGRLSKEMPIQASNVLVVCEKCNAATRLGTRYESDGSKHRFCRKCGTAIGQIAPTKAAYASK